MTDAELVARAKGGDAPAFGELVDRHRIAVYRTALAALGSHAEAEDAAQDAFLLAYRRLAGFRGDASFKTWLLTIAWHQAINRRRSLVRIWKRMIEPAVDAGDPLALVAARDATPEERLSQAEMGKAIRVEIRALSPKLRDALLLAQAGEYSYEEIAAMLEIPVGTLKWRVAEARRLIKQRLGRRGLGDGDYGR